MDSTSSESDSPILTRRSKRKKELSTSSSSSSGSIDERQQRILRRRRKRRRQEETIESDSSDSDDGKVTRNSGIVPETSSSSSSSSSSMSSASESESGFRNGGRFVSQQASEDSHSGEDDGTLASPRRGRSRAARSFASLVHERMGLTQRNQRLRNQPSDGDGAVTAVIHHARTVASRRLESAMDLEAEQEPLAVAAAQEAGAAGDLSDSGGEEGGEKCSVCLRRIRNQEIGNPEGCDHTFCLACLVTWSKSCNQCPLDRRPFRLILVRENLQGPVTRQLAVEERAQPVVFDEEDLSFCLICGEFDRDEVMLLCDGCDRGFHIDCLTPPLPAVPEVEEWFCPTCEAWRQVTAEVIARVDRQEPAGYAVTQRMPRVGSMARSRGASARNFLPLPRISIRSANNLLDALSQVDAPTPNNTIQAGPSTSGTQSIRRRRITVKKKTRNLKKRKTVRSRYVTKKKKIFVENDDGTITEEVTSVRTKVNRRKKKRKAVKRKKTSRVGVSCASCGVSRGSRSCGTTGTCTSTRDRLERNLASVAADATSRRRASPAVASNLSRVSAGIPTLNIFEPRHELAPVSSGSDEELGGGGEVGLLSRGRSARPRPIERSKAIELLRSAPSRPRAVPQAYEGPSDLLSSILESQAIWHSKKSDVTIRNDGTVETSSNRVDVRSARPERVATAAPVFPGAGPGPYRPGGDNSTSPSSSQSRPAAASPAAAASSAGPRSGPVNDREGYSNFLNNLSLRPAPFCRGGPPLRIRMPIRPQLRRIPLVPRRRALYDEEDDVDEQGEKKEDGEDKDGANADEMSGEAGDDTDAGEKQEVDLYSDIEPNAERDVSESESVGQYSALGPPPEPPAFLLSMTSGEDKKSEKKDSDVYDPAEPCDSGDELVIDETPAAAPAAAAAVVAPLQPPPEPPAVLNDVLADSVDSSENSCPVLQLYSSDSVAFSHKDEDERAKALSSDKTNRTETDQLPHSMPVDDVSQEAKSPVCEKDLAEKDEGTPDVAKDRSPSPVKENSRSPSSSPSRRSRRSQSSSPSPMRTRKDSTHSQKSRSPASFTTKRRKRRSLENDSSDDSDTSPRLSTRDSTKKDSKQNDEPSTNGDNPRVSTGLEGLEVEEVSSDMEENDFNDSHLSSLSLSGISDHSRSSSPTMKKKKKKKRAKIKSKSKKTASEEGEIESDKEKPKKTSKKDRRTSDADKNGVSNRRPSKNRSPGRKVLSSQENKKINVEDEEGWKKMPTKGRNYRESRKSSKERGLSSEKKRGGSSSPKRDKKKSKDKKKSDKKKEIERYDVRKVVKEREHVRKDEFGRDLPVVSGSRSRTKSRSRSRSRGRGAVRPPKRDASHSPARRAARSPSRRRRRRRSVSRSPLSPRRNRRARRSSDRDGRKGSRSRPRRSPSSSPSPRRNRNLGRSRKSRSPSISLSPAPRARDAYSPVRVIRRSISPAPIRSYVKAWSPNVTREKSLENLTVVLKSKDKKKRKKKKDERRELKSVESKRKKSGNSKEVFASGDNVLVSVNFSSKSNKSSNVIVIPDIPMREVSSKKKKKRMAMDNNERPAKKNRTVNTVTKSAVDNALSSEGLAMRKKVGRLTGEDAEEILKRKPVAVIDLDMSPYREQTPSPINVVVVSDSGSGDEGKGPAPGKPQQRPRSPEIIILPTPAALTTSGPKTPPEPPLKFSISKGAQIRPIANPLAEPDDEGEEAAVENQGQAEESVEVIHKGPNTPPAPRGPSTPPRGPTTPPMMGPNTPRSLQSPQSSPDAYDPFEPTKSRSPSPGGLAADVPVDKPTVAESSSSIGPVVIVPSEEAPKHAESNEAVSQETPTVNSVTDVNSAKESSPIQVVDLVSASSANFNKTASVRKSTPQPMTPNAVTTLQAFSLPSPKTPNRTNSSTLVSGIHRLQHRLGSPVSKTPNSVKSTPEKRGNDTLLAPRSKRNGPVPDGSNETVDMDDSPYSPGSSEGDDLFDPPPAAAASHPPPAATQATHKPTKPKATTTPVKTVSKFDQLFGSSVSPMKNGGKKTGRVPKTALPKVASEKKTAKPAAGTPAKKGVASKMDEDQLRILDEVPSSAVELQVKDMFLKKLNRQERVVDEVKTVLKPHYAKKHITKEEYKQILRRAVPKICHSKSGEINPSKIQQLVEAYVRKYRQNKKKGGVQKSSKLMKSGMFS